MITLVLVLRHSIESRSNVYNYNLLTRVTRKTSLELVGKCTYIEDRTEISSAVFCGRRKNGELKEQKERRPPTNIHILTIFPRARVGYEMVDSQRGA